MLERVDLRSDTVTRPTPAMRRAMAEAEVGDDVYGEDPTVRRLEERSAEALGFEAALFVPSGTMGNQIAVRLLARRGEEAVVEERSHVFNYEMAAMADLSGVLARPVRSERGFPAAADLEAALRPDIYYLPRTGLITWENTHNLGGGAVAPEASTRAMLELAGRRGIPVHLDGARIFNAACARGVTAASLCSGFTTVMTCLSKGLGAPVGSVLASDGARITEARRIRKRLGGGMRQAGVLAAAGLVALEQMVGRLGEDHARARRLAEGFGAIPGLRADPARVETNILMVDVEREGWDAARLIEALGREGVLALAMDRRRIRMVTHYDVDDAGIERALGAAARALR
jgi:threonine aldolase